MPSSPQRPAVEVYRRYIACLNARALEALGEFVADDVTRNGQRLGLEGYRAMLEGNYRDIPDLRFRADWIAAEETRLACRLGFDCSPIGEFLGVKVNGKRIVFHEHALYTLRDGKISEVWSIIDKAEIEAQAGA
jgi:predicted ester cyclase